MENLLAAFLKALSENPVVALALLSIMANLILGATVKRLFALYQMTMELRVKESGASRDAISDAIHKLDRVVDVLRVQSK